MLYMQSRTSDTLGENKLCFQCENCGVKKKISAKFLIREAKEGRAYLIKWYAAPREI